MSADRCSRVAALAAVALALASPATLASSDAAPAEAELAVEFPEFEAIRPNVEFWKEVYARWTSSQVAVHDLEHLGVVYEVADLPGPSEERYTDEQRDFIELLVERWEGRLRELEHRVAHGEPLDDADKALALQIASQGGTDALRDAAERVRTQRGMRERFRRGIEIGARYDAWIRQTFREHGLPEDLAYLPHVESSFQSHARSSAGAVGVWQFTRGTGSRYLSINSAIDERLDPLIAADGAARYLREAHERLQDWPIALTSYNHGLNGMARAVGAHGRDYLRIFEEYEGRLFGFASRNFYAEFLAAREIAAHPERYFPEGLQLEPPLELDTFVLESPTAPSRLARAHGLAVEEVAQLNPAWSSRAVRSDLALPRGTRVWLPPGTLAKAASPGATPSRAADGADVYLVQPGDSLSEIASAFGIPLARLRELNGLAAAREHRIHVGQPLRVGDGGGSHDVHVVRRGESLFAIALRYQVELRELLRVNALDPRSTIHPGQRIRIP